MNALIFGINGQDGHYLDEICQKKNINTIGVSRTDNHWKKGNVADKKFVEELVKKHKPEYIFHVAANSTTKHDVLFENHETIATGTLNILESARIHSPGSKIFITGSGMQFKNTGKPIRETDEFEGSSGYSVARIQSVYAARYFRSLGLKTYVGYLFHHDSPFRKDSHISKYTTNIIKRIAQGSNEKIELGDIHVKKEWGYAKDISEGIFTLLEQDTVFEAAIGTGIGYSIDEWLVLCFKFIGKDSKNYIITSENFKPEFNSLVSNPETMKKLGWTPATSFENLCAIMMK